MFRDYKSVIALLSRCSRTIFLFEILFRLFSVWMVFPICKWLFNSCLRATGLYYLTAENLTRFLTHPITLLCCAAIFLIFSLAEMIEISCLIICLHAAHINRPINIFRLIFEGIRDSVRLLKPRNLPLLLITAFLLPVMQLPTDTSPLRLIGLPWNSIAKYAVRFPYILIVFIYAAGVVTFFCLVMCAYHEYVLEKSSAKQALTDASTMNHGRRMFRILEISLLVIAACVVTFGSSALISLVTERTVAIFTDSLSIRYRILQPLDTVLDFFKSSLPSIVICAIISVIYYCNKRDKGEAAFKKHIPHKESASRFNAIAFYVVAILAALSIILYDAVLRPMLVRYDALQYMDDQPTLIIAHRGYFADSDENTITAFRTAFDLGADYVELDVQQTADGVVIVNHDFSFERIYGDPRKVWDLTYDEIRTLSARISGECPPTLYDVLSLCDPQTNLLIELKNNGHNPDLPRAVYDILCSFDCFDRCSIQSPSYKMLSEFKALAPDVRCGYILSFALGQYASLDAVDFFSVDNGFVSESVLSSVHRLGKQVYAWTINDEERMRQLQKLGVDGIITDELPLAKIALFSISSSPLDELISEPIEDAFSQEDPQNQS